MIMMAATSDDDDDETFEFRNVFAEEMKAKLVRHAVELFLRLRRSFVSHLSTFGRFQHCQMLQL